MMSKRFVVAAAVAATGWSLFAYSRAEWEGGKRAEVLDWFRNEYFGNAPNRPADEKFDDEGVSFAEGKFKIRIHRTLPANASRENPAPVFLLLDHYYGADRRDGRWFRPNMPTNTVVARGYAYLNVNLNDVALNAYDERMTNMVHSYYGCAKDSDWGTISAWAWGVSRVMDWIEQRPELDAKRVAVLGHSRGGKTALWAACNDERIAMACPNGSGTGGTRWLDCDLVDAEPLDWMLGHAIKTWFCRNLQKHRGNVRELPYTAADLIRLVCPRLVYVGSGSEDDWAGPQGEFEAARQASDLWRAYGLKGLGTDSFPRPGVWDHSGRVGYSLRPGPHDLTAWNWERLLDFADLHMKKGCDDGAQEAVPSVEAKGLCGRPARLHQRVDPVGARYYDRDMNVKLVGWRGERVNAQVVVWSDEDQGRLSAGSSDFVSKGGAKISADCVRARFVRTCRAPHSTQKDAPVHDLADCLDPAAQDWPKENFRAVWFSLDIPNGAEPGVYTAEYRVKGAKGEVCFPVALKVQEQVLPPVRDRKFFLDLWQHPWSIAKYYGVKPFSKEHYAFMEPVYRQLAEGPQKVISTSIVDLPWGENYAGDRGEIRTMVEYVKNPDGSFTADFTNFDTFVAFAKKCGLGPQIHCYTICKFNSKHIFYYTDGVTGERRAEELYEGTSAYENFLTPLLEQLEGHLVAKGWIDDAYIAIDEVPPERLPVVREFLRKVAPKLKFALASNVDPFRYRSFEKDVDVFSQILWTGNEITNLFTKAFDDEFLGKRREAGRVTTFYVCTEPQQPNTWFKSPLVETEWLGLYAAAKGYDGFLRWATFLWGKDPFEHPEGEGYPTGEDFLIYPGGLASIRWEFLKDSMENWEKIRILREQGRSSVALEEALCNLNYPFSGEDDADACSLRWRVDAVKSEIERCSGSGLDFGGTTFDFAARSAAIFDEDGKRWDAPAEDAAFLTLNPVGYLDNRFAVSAGQPVTLGFGLDYGKKFDVQDRKGLTFVLTLPAGFEFIGANFADKDSVRAEPLPGGAMKYTFAPFARFSFKYISYNRMTAMIRSTDKVGTSGPAKLEAFKDGREWARRIEFRLFTIEPIRAEKPSRYMNGFYSAGQSAYFYGNMKAERAFAEIIGFCGCQWMLGEKSDPDCLKLWREAGVKAVTPPIGIANAYSLYGKDVWTNMPKEDHFVFSDTYEKESVHYNKIFVERSICPFAVIEERPYFVNTVVPALIDERLKGMDGSWANWEPHMFEGYGCECATCKAEFAKWKARTGKDDLGLFRSEVHGQYIRVLDKYVRRATKNSKFQTGLIPGVCWRACTTAFREKLFSKEYNPADYASDLEWFDPWGPYLYWNAEKPLARNEREPVWHWFFAKDMREQCDRWSKPGKRMKIQAFPHGVQEIGWVGQPEHIGMACDAFFFNRWDNTLVYFFPNGYDARYLKAFADSTTRAARCEEYVWEGERCDAKLSVDIVPAFAPRRKLVSDYVPSSTNQPLLQYAAYDLKGVRLFAALNFCDYAPAFFTLKASDLKGEYRVVDEDGALWYEGTLGKGAFLMVGAARTKVFYLVPKALSAGPKVVRTIAQEKVRALYADNRERIVENVKAGEAARERRAVEVKPRGLID